jgi:DNA mismatch repair protein MutS
MALIKEYFELCEKYKEDYGEKTILLMQVGSFFEVYGIYNKKTDIITGSKIVDFSQICELNIVEKNTCVGTDNVMMAGFKDMQIEKYIKKIQEAGFTAVVYVQDEAAKNTTRSLGGIFSPGTYFHTESQNLTNSITCIWIDMIENKVLLKGKYVVVGVSNIDIYTGKTNIFQFKEVYINNPTTYDELERFISIYNPSEVIIISNLPEEKEIDYVINYAGISCNLIHKIHIPSNSSNISEKGKRVKNCEKQIYQTEVLSKFYKFDDFNVFIQNFYDNNIATQAFCFLLDFVYQHNPHLVNKISEPSIENCSTRMALANHSLKQLNIINDGNVKSSKFSCVCNMLNECLTPMGKRKFSYNFLNPVHDAIYLQREYDTTEYFLSVYNNYDTYLKHRLSSVKDISKWSRQIFLKKISPKAFYNLFNNIVTIENIFAKIAEDAFIMDYLQTFEPNIISIDKYCNTINEFIKSNLNLELAKEIEQLQNFETNFINNGVDAELDKKMQVLQESELKLEAIRNYLSSIIEGKEKKGKKTTGKGKITGNEKANNDEKVTDNEKADEKVTDNDTTKSDYVKIHETEKNNLGIISTSRRCKLLIDSLPKDPTIVSLQYTFQNVSKKYEFKVSSSQFSFEKQNAANNFIIDEQISGLCKSITTSKVTMKELITFIYNKFISKFESFQKELESIVQFITYVDLLYTKASIAKKYNYCKPNIVKSDKSFIDATNLRHCLIEQFQSNEIYVTNDISLGTGKVDGLMLYGTNAVGKTSFIKSIGISVIMAQSGLYVPASEFRFCPYKYIFTRIIGNDNIFKGQSTFAVEMSELRTILRLADENSLILGDELCSGTEIMSAISIFVAGIQHLYKRKSSFIFATHLHEIINYEEIKSLSSVALKHMEVIYDKERDILVYDRKLKDGPGNSMYGLEVCKSLNLPQEFLDAAYDIRMKYQPENGSILSLKTSSYNTKKLVSICERCNVNPGKEVHHLTYQSDANEQGIIKTKEQIFHKNNLANLMTLCESCHNDIHKKNEKLKKMKTTKGIKITPT